MSKSTSIDARCAKTNHKLMISHVCVCLMSKRNSYSVECIDLFFLFYGRYGDLIQKYEVSLSRMLNDILTLDQQWLPNQSDFSPISWPWCRLWPLPNYEWFPWSICNGCGMPAGKAYPSGHLLRPPFWDLLVLQFLRPDSLNLPCLYSTFHLEYPLVLSRFCFLSQLSRKREDIKSHSSV